MKHWVFTFRVEPPADVVSARVGNNIFFAAYSKFLKQWFMVYPGGEQKIPQPDMIYIESEWADTHKRDRPPIHVQSRSKSKKSTVQLQLF